MNVPQHIELTTGADPVATVIWMHGLGADGWDFVPIVRELDLEEVPLRFIFPHAPVRPVTINNGHEMRAWYDIAQSDIARVPDEAGIRDSQRSIEALIDRERGRGVEATHIILAGFSQGGVIALQAGLRYRERLGGIIALSTYLALEDSLDREAAPANRTTPILMAHGTQDPVVPLQLGEQAQRALTSRGYKVDWNTYPMPHAVCAEEVEMIGDFLARVTGAQGEDDGALRSSSILLPGR